MPSLPSSHSETGTGRALVNQDSPPNRLSQPRRHGQAADSYFAGKFTQIEDEVHISHTAEDVGSLVCVGGHVVRTRDS